MTAPMDDAPGGPQVQRPQGFLSRQLGPLPMWAWLGVGLGGLLALASWRKNKQQAQQNVNQGTLPTTQTASGSTPASLIPQFVNQVFNQESPPIVNVTNTQTTSNPVTVNPPATGAPAPPPPHNPPPAPPPAKPPAQQPQGQWVTVGVWNSTNAPWNSTLWGIAQHIYGNGALYPKIWQANAPGVMRPDGSTNNPKDTNANLIHPGDRIWVPA